MNFANTINRELAQSRAQHDHILVQQAVITIIYQHPLSRQLHYPRAYHKLGQIYLQNIFKHLTALAQTRAVLAENLGVLGIRRERASSLEYCENSP